MRERSKTLGLTILICSINNAFDHVAILATSEEQPLPTPNPPLSLVFLEASGHGNISLCESLLAEGVFTLSRGPYCRQPQAGDNCCLIHQARMGLMITGDPLVGNTVRKALVWHRAENTMSGAMHNISFLRLKVKEGKEEKLSGPLRKLDFKTFSYLKSGIFSAMCGKRSTTEVPGQVAV